MKYASPLVEARLVRRYKRFLADVILPDDTEITVHVANPGAMTGLASPGARVFLSKSDDLKRKLAYSWELVEADFGAGAELVGVNTAHPNRLIAEALRGGKIPQLAGYETIRREVKYGRRSRIDFLLESPGRPSCYLEIKNVHLMRVQGRAEFPDCVTARGARHLDELAAIRVEGARAILLYLVQIGSARSVSVARDIDPAYAAAFGRARVAGVEVLARVCRLTHDEIGVDREVPVAD